jgi:hypothetical protein
VWGNTVEESADIVPSNYPVIIGKELEQNLLKRLNTVLCCLIEIKTTLPQGQPVLTLVCDPMLVDTIPIVEE